MGPSYVANTPRTLRCTAKEPKDKYMIHKGANTQTHKYTNVQISLLMGPSYVANKLHGCATYMYWPALQFNALSGHQMELCSAGQDSLVEHLDKEGAKISRRGKGKPSSSSSVDVAVLGAELPSVFANLRLSPWFVVHPSLPLHPIIIIITTTKGEGRRCQACIYHLFSPPHIFQGHFSVRQYFRANLGFQHKNLWVNFKDLSTHRYFYFPMSMSGHNLLGSLLWSSGHNLSKPNQLCALWNSVIETQTFQ